jgi:YfiR/HmsC-like
VADGPEVNSSEEHVLGAGPKDRVNQYRLLSMSYEALVLLLCSVAFAPATTANAQMDEYSIKAGYLYNFSKYVAWPEQAFGAPDAPFTICIVGDDPFGNRLDQAISGKTAGDGRALEIRRLKSDEPTSLRECQVAFLGKSEKERAAAIIDAVKRSAVLTVADFSPFAENGGVADLRIDGTKVKVDLNMNAANRANLKVSGKLQQVATLVN